MTREECAGVLAYLAAGIGKPVPPEQAKVYFDLLNDLPAPVVAFAARQALLESEYPTLPPVGILRRLAVQAQKGTPLPPAAEAYSMVLRCINAPYRLRKAKFDSLPVPVRQAALAMGLDAIGDSTSPETCRAQFTRAYEAYVGRAEREVLLPPGLREFAESIGRVPEESKPRALPDARDAGQ